MNSIRLALALILTAFSIVPICSFAAANASQDDVTCANIDDSITVTTHFTNKVATEIEWRVTRSGPADHYPIVSATNGSSLWPEMPTNAFTHFPFGSYIGKLNGDTVILSILRDASYGGGGHLWEGVLNFLGADGRAISWGMFCR